jgi:hypothetical protein
MGDAVCRQCGEIFAVRVDEGCSFLVEHGLNNEADRGASIGVAPGLRDPVAALGQRRVIAGRASAPLRRQFPARDSSDS